MKPHKLPRVALLSLLVLSILILGIFTFSSRSAAQVRLSGPSGLPGSSGPSGSSGTTALWRDVDESLLRHLALNREIVPQRYRTVAVDYTALLSLLAGAPMEDVAPLPQSGSVLSMPMPDGSFQRFRIENSPIMAPELAVRHPEIKTFRGQGIDDPTATTRFGWTTGGFHAIILSGTGTTYIDRYAKGDILHYISYYKRDYKTDKRIGCLFKGKSNAVASAESLETMDAAAVPLDPNGDIRRTYRLALAANYEYTQFHSGPLPTLANKSDALNKGIIPTMNRVNGIYERDFAVHMNLIPNEEEIIFDTPADPYVNEDGQSMLFTNTAVLDTIIGQGNYDIGHVFSTGGGGIAGLGVVCSTAALGHKAEGVTGNPSPISDSFDVDYVAHEMGHQYGGNHTFNGSTGSCSGTNRNASTAYEVGSGATIQAYAGICGVQNLQPNSDDYFHNISYREMQDYVSIGGGSACAATTATGNTPPKVDAGPNYNIPARTAFSLTATGEDADATDTGLTYTWEEFDLGAAGDGNTDNGSSPILRSFDPTTSSTRTFPKQSDLLNNVSSYGEKLPTTTRKMDFCVTIRDNRAGAGGVDYDCMRVNVTAHASGFRVLAANGGETWTGGGTQTVTWDPANTTETTGPNPINTQNVNILLSTDGGVTFPHVLATGVPNDGSHNVISPNVGTTQARVKVEGAGNIFFDISNNNFTVQVAAGLPSAVDDTATTATNTSVIIPVLGNDSDPNGDTIAITAIQSPTSQLGSAVLDNNGTSETGDDRILYTPANGFSGVDTFTYTITAGGDSDTGLVTVNVLAAGPPVAVDDVASTNVNTPVTISVLTNDFDPDDPIAITAVDSPTGQGGTALVDNNGTPGNTSDDRIIYAPPSGFTGIDTFNYTITGGAQTDSALVTVTVQSGCPPLTNGSFSDDFEPPQTPGWTVDTAINNFPVSPTWAIGADPQAHSASNSYSSDSAAADLKDDRLVSPPQDLSSTSQLIFWHRYSFEDGFDGGVLEISTDGGTTWVDVGPGSFVSGGYTDVISGGFASPIANRPAWSGNSSGFPTSMNQVVVNLGAYAGLDRKLRWRLGLDNGSLTTGVRWWIDDVQFTNLLVENTNCPQPPTPVDDADSTNEDTAKIINVVANDTDPNSDTLTVTAVTDPPHGSATNNGNGTVTYTPDANYFGPDSFSYTVCDPGPLCASADVSVTVVAVNDNPQASNDAATVNENSGPNTIDVLHNDTDAPDSGETLTIQSVTQGANGTVVITDGGALLTYQPNAGFDGNDSFTYTVTDGNGGSATATVAVTVVPTSGLVNYARTALGAVPSASSTYTSRNYSVTSAFDGDIRGANWEQGGGWNDNTRGVWPDTLDVTFGGGAKTISEIRVYTLQNNPGSAVIPDATTDASYYGIQDFEIQAWNGLMWVTLNVPTHGVNGNIVGNSKALRVFTLGTPISTTAVRIKINLGRVHYSRIVELEAYGPAGQ